MNFLISIIITIFIIFIGRNFIKKHSKLCYVISALISIALVIASYSGVLSNLSHFAILIYFLYLQKAPLLLQFL